MKQIAILPVSLYVFLFCIGLSFEGNAQEEKTEEYNTTSSFTAPAGVTTVLAEVWGAGGGGSRVTTSGRAGGGGGGGAYNRGTVTITAGVTYNVAVGTGGTGESSNNNGGPSSFNSVFASGGSGAPLNSTNGGLGGTDGLYSGGNGESGISLLWSGGGGGAAGSTGNGYDASNYSGGNPRANNGGSGADGVSSQNSGLNGSNYGGGGSGGHRRLYSDDPRSGGRGANGLVRLTYTCPEYSLTSLTVTSSVCPGSPATVKLNGTTTNLPVGQYTVTYTRNGGSSTTTNITISTEGGGTSGEFFTPNLTVTTTIAITNLRSGSSSGTTGFCDNNFNTANTATVNVGLPTITTTPATRCGAGQVILGATTSAGTIEWFASAIGGSSLGTGTSFETPSMSSTTTYYVSASNGSCTSARTAVIATVNTIPSAPAVDAITQPDCTLATGSVVLYNLPTGSWTLTRNDGATTTGLGATANITGLIPGTSYTYTVTGATNCTSAVSADIVINERPNCWTGDANADWNNASNWIHGVPTNGVSLNTIIPSGLSNYPEIHEGAPSGYVNTMVLENDATITVMNNSLRVIEDLKLDGKIFLKGESQLLQNLDSTLDETSSGTIEINQQGTADTYTYNYWSSPVVSNTLNNSYTVANVLRDGTNETPRAINFINSGHDGTPGSSITPIGIASYWIHKYSSSSNGYNGWNRIRSTGDLKVGEGFTMKGVENTNNNVHWEQNYVFVGKPNNGNITLLIGEGNDYLIGNPYPSALDADEFILDNIADGAGRASQNIINGALYFWDHFGGGSHLLSEYEGGYATYTLMGGAIAIKTDARINIDGDLVGTKEPKRFIPVAQGFFVSSILDENLIMGEFELESPVVGGTITFKNSQRVFKTEEDSEGSPFMKPSNTKGKATAEKQVDTRQKIRLMFNSPKGYHRQLLVGADARASNGFDLGFDAPLIETNKEDMFWVFKNNEFVIQAVNNFDEEQKLPLGMRISQAGISKVKIDDLENMPNNAKIYLNDKELGVYHPITESAYEVYLEPGDYLDRFEITFKSSGTLTVDDVTAQENIQVYFSNQSESIIVHNPVLREIKSVELVNLLGQSILKFNEGTNQNYVEYKTNQISAGVYVIKVQTVEGSVSKKVLIK